MGCGCCTMHKKMAQNYMDAPHANDISAKMVRTPQEYGMNFEEVTFPATDGVKISAWYIPSKDKDSKKLAICSHQSWSYANKSGMIGLKMPPAPGMPKMMWQNAIDYVKLHKVLYDDGFHVLAYDQRNHGSSERKLPSGWGLVEFQDAAGAMDYVNSHPTLTDCKVVLFPFCVAGLSMLKANHHFPDKFKNVVACCGTNLFSSKNMAVTNPGMMGTIKEEALNKEMASKKAAYIANGTFKEDPNIDFTVAALDCAVYAKSMKVPILYCTPEKDPASNQAVDAPYVFSGFPNKESEFHFIGKKHPAPYKMKTDNRSEGYNFYQNEGTQVMYDFLHKHGL